MTRSGDDLRSGPARQMVLALCRRYVDDPLEIVEPGRRHRFGSDGPDELGRRPLRGTMTVHDERAWWKVLSGGSAGLGEAYLDGWWDTDDLTAVLRILGRATRRTDRHRSTLHRAAAPASDALRRLRRQDRHRDRTNIRAHYDLGNDFFEHFLDPTMMYSAAVFPTWDAPLEEASQEKLDRLCRLLDLRPDDRVVEIGTGWGGFAVHAARRYGARVTTTTISAEQHAYAVERVEREGLADRVTVLHDDYRDLTGTYDKLASIEMIEAVDWREHDTFFERCRHLLAPDGLMALQAILIEPQRYERAKTTQDFIKRFIFPGGCLPSMEAILRSARRVTDLSVTAVHDYGLHYAETLRRWQANLHRDDEALGAMGLDERFVRMWDFYLAYCEAAFEERSISVVQMALARPAWRPHAPEAPVVTTEPVPA
ncbi:MAG TPA: cyclopropane-fatty-acyl-phospholipid synthase family protein [Acidimicrobiales bacterium]